MRNDRRNKNRNYMTDDFPPNYSGQYTRLPEPESTPVPEEITSDILSDKKNIKESESKGILGSLGNIFKKRENNNGILSGLFSGKKIKNIFTDLDFEDLILIGVMFFLLRDGAEDELLIILAIILFTGA